jgi:photosystem II stability/assembly factor-like uncharacterized protein
MRTVDGGQTWRADTVAGATALDFRAIHARSSDVAWVMSAGEHARIYHTTDGGRHWTLQHQDTTKGAFLDAIAFWDARRGLAFGDPVDGHFMLLATDDGGRSWNRLPPSATPPVLPNEAAFAASNTCLVTRGRSSAWFVTGGGERSRVFRTSDAGHTWMASDSPIRAGVASAGIFSFATRDGIHAVIVGGDFQKPADADANAARSNDGGRSWTPSTKTPAGYRSAVAYRPGRASRSYVAVGLTGTDISRDDGATWSKVDSVAYNSVAFSPSGDAGFAVGPKGKVAKWTAK